MIVRPDVPEAQIIRPDGWEAHLEKLAKRAARRWPLFPTSTTRRGAKGS